MSRLSSVASPSVAVMVVTIVFELSVLVLIVVSEAVLDPITITFGTFCAWNRSAQNCYHFLFSGLHFLVKEKCLFADCFLIFEKK